MLKTNNQATNLNVVSGIEELSDRAAEKINGGQASVSISTGGNGKGSVSSTFSSTGKPNTSFINGISARDVFETGEVLDAVWKMGILTTTAELTTDDGIYTATKTYDSETKEATLTSYSLDSE